MNVQVVEVFLESLVRQDLEHVVIVSLFPLEIYPAGIDLPRWVVAQLLTKLHFVVPSQSYSP